MSYAQSLDQFREDELVGEIARRKALREAGVCDYCERSGNQSSCQFPNRHQVALEFYNKIHSTNFTQEGKIIQ